MIRKALIPVAGLGARLRPFTLAVPKALLPLPDATGRIRPVIDFIIAEASSAGVTRVGLIVSPGQQEMIERYFSGLTCSPGSVLPERIEYILQPKPAGFGDAVARGRHFVGDEPFMLLLGDHVYLPGRGAPPCAAQVASALAEYGGAAMVGVQPVDEAALSRVGVVQGAPLGGRTYRCTGFIEKPTVRRARMRLVTPRLPKGTFLAHCGTYVFSPEIFHCLEELDRTGRRTRGELQLADAQSMLLARHAEDYFLHRIAGRAYDTGTAQGYVEAFRAFSRPAQAQRR
jgi:UTP--glucose-1-phosphate uridylyltransferase